MAKYRKLPVVIEAVQFDGSNSMEIMVWAKLPDIEEDFLENKIRISTLVKVTFLKKLMRRLKINFLRGWFGKRALDIPASIKANPAFILLIN